MTEAEEQSRRAKVKPQRRRRGRKCRPRPKAEPGAGQHDQAFTLVTHYGPTQEHRHVSVTRGDGQAAGDLTRRDAGALRWDQAGDKVALVEGAPWVVDQVEGQRLPLDAIGLGSDHLAGDVQKARRVVYGGGPPGATARPGPPWASAVPPTAEPEG